MELCLARQTLPAPARSSSRPARFMRRPSATPAIAWPSSWSDAARIRNRTVQAGPLKLSWDEIRASWTEPSARSESACFPGFQAVRLVS